MVWRVNRALQNYASETTEVERKRQSRDAEGLDTSTGAPNSSSAQSP